MPTERLVQSLGCHGGAAAFGFRAIWVDQGQAPGEYDDLPPTAVVRDLSGVLALAR